MEHGTSKSSTLYIIQATCETSRNENHLLSLPLRSTIRKYAQYDRIFVFYDGDNKYDKRHLACFCPSWNVELLLLPDAQLKRLLRPLLEIFFFRSPEETDLYAPLQNAWILIFRPGGRCDYGFGLGSYAKIRYDER